MDYRLDWNKLIDFEENNTMDIPKLSIPFFLDTSCLKREFTLDIVVWNLTAANLEQTLHTGKLQQAVRNSLDGPLSFLL